MRMQPVIPVEDGVKGEQIQTYAHALLWDVWWHATDIHRSPISTDVIANWRTSQTLNRKG